MFNQSLPLINITTNNHRPHNYKFDEININESPDQDELKNNYIDGETKGIIEFPQSDLEGTNRKCQVSIIDDPIDFNPEIKKTELKDTQIPTEYFDFYNK